MLHRNGGNLNQVTSKGWSTLMLAAKGKHPLIVEYLLANEVDTELRNSKRKTAKDIAIKSKEQAVIELLADNESVY